MKKIIAIALATCLSASLIGCSSLHSKDEYFYANIIPDIDAPSYAGVVFEQMIDFMRTVEHVSIVQYKTHGSQTPDETERLHARIQINHKTGEYSIQETSSYNNSTSTEEKQMYVCKNPDSTQSEYIVYRQDKNDRTAYFGYENTIYDWLYLILDSEYLWEYIRLEQVNGDWLYVFENDGEMAWSYQKAEIYISPEDNSLRRAILYQDFLVADIYETAITYDFSYDKQFTIEIPEELQSIVPIDNESDCRYEGFYPREQNKKLSLDDWSLRVNENIYYLGSCADIFFPEGQIKYVENDSNKEVPNAISDTIIYETRDGISTEYYLQESPYMFHFNGIFKEGTQIVLPEETTTSMLINPDEYAKLTFNNCEVEIYNPTTQPLPLNECVFGRFYFTPNDILYGDRTVDSFSFRELVDMFGPKYFYDASFFGSYYLAWNKEDYYIVTQCNEDKVNAIWFQHKGGRDELGIFGRILANTHDVQ